jgi:hypothetical protein
MHRAVNEAISKLDPAYVESLKRKSTGITSIFKKPWDKLDDPFVIQMEGDAYCLAF